MNEDKNGPGSVKMAVNIVKKYGIRKLFLGLNVTLVREIAGLTIYFGSYDFVLQSMMSMFGLDLMTASFQAGGVAGMLTWSAIYPIHYVKVKVQNDSLDNP